MTTIRPGSTGGVARGGPAARRALGTAGWLGAAGFAAALASLSALAPHRVWGWCAAVGYLTAALAGRLPARLPTRRPARLRHAPSAGSALPVGCALVGAVLVPLAVLLATGRAQSEVLVIERSAATLLHSGTPYPADPQAVTDYNPYLPGMALFGMPARLFGDGSAAFRPVGDPRLWCAAALVACLAAAHTVLRRGTTPGTATRSLGAGYATAVLVASPLVALPLCVSGIDLPLTGLLALALALAARHRPVAAGLALAAACSLKWTALPAVAVAVALVAAGRGRRAAVRCAAVWAGGTLALVLPALLVAPGRLVEQVLLFPTGRGAVPTPAASPLPGRLLADLGPAGWCAAVLLLLCGGAAVAVSLVVRPPRSLAAAADRLAAGLCLAFLLAPAGRFGYFALPLLLALWARLAPAGPPGRPAVRHRVRAVHVPGAAPVAVAVRVGVPPLTATPPRRARPGGRRAVSPSFTSAGAAAVTVPPS
ncbi:glycosyltransferase 87 family protein [Kitasatospora sp. NPDC101447]|uniref:glycosyltransferase 87 family protein n=1 Tax=Kitasatospora sp. NPDC101447 TaxID=3364102 RepID=UPI003811F7F9